ncbi:DNA polymerase zeta catalytic subunit [Selaginella moellendorffii]|uniref:DNA polymerase zeta catalytic subunit n=1 Tax=Selaginella moellendorffii TaxID=88036 RepID=UPI000D1D0D0C|nr:DNA polymerase zeta catalytic subunit [Selaginella moellendorffii]|eukprot:XP_024534003.1 DNA polymerase zeta catalytic subunit [Selaginella moellendorffii]
MAELEEGERVFGIRIVNLDYYTAAPLVDMDECYSHFFGRSVMEVPVVRIYGSTLAGQKTCLHLHKALPYFYVPYDDDLPQSLEEAMAFVRRLALALERAMKMASSIGAKRQHVHSCDLVRAKKLYGYHPSEDTFIKITLYYPQEASQMSAFLLSGGILNRKFQPYEAHIPYLLQLKIDYNLAGMGLLEVSSLRFRSPLPDTPNERKRKISALNTPAAENDGSWFTSSSDYDIHDFWLSSNIPSHQVWSDLSQDKASPSRCSTCELEADAPVEAILNKDSLSYTPLEQIDPGRMLVQSLIPIWEGQEQEDLTSSFLSPQPHKHFAAEALHKEILKSVWMSGATPQPQDNDLLESSQPANLYRSPSAAKGFSQEVKPTPEDSLHNEMAQSTSQPDLWKAADEDALELLKWMVSSQNNNCEGDVVAANEQDHGEIDLCRLFEGDGVEAALQKTLSTFEIMSQRECQDIVDCFEEDGEEKEVLVAEEGTSGIRIPQYDGAGDEEPPADVTETGKRVGNRSWGRLPITVKGSPAKPGKEEASVAVPLRPCGSPQEQARESRSETSVRDLMRIKRGKQKGGRQQEPETESAVKPQGLRKCLLNQYGALPLQSHMTTEPVETSGDNENSQPAAAVEKDVVLPKNGELAMIFHQRPPSNNDILASFKSYGLKDVEYPNVSYGGSEDMEKSAAIFAGDPARRFDIDDTVIHLLTPALAPPSNSSVCEWLAKENLALNSLQKEHVASTLETPSGRPASPKYNEMHVLSDEFQSGEHSNTTLEGSAEAKRRSRDFSQITGPSLAAHRLTPASQTGFRDPAAAGAGQQVTVMSIEALAETRGSLRPDPHYDSISCIAIVVADDTETTRETIALIHDKELQDGKRPSDGLSCSPNTSYFPTEVALLQFFIELVRAYDPDIIIGWEIQRLSLGFLAERAANLGVGLLASISRTPPRSGHNSLSSTFFSDGEKTGGIAEANKTIIQDEWGRTHGSGIYVGGRTVLNLWRIMRGEVKLSNYTIECVGEEVLKRKVPRISWRDLTKWFASGAGGNRFRSVEYLINRTALNLQILDQLDIVNRTAELARVFGIDFYSVFSRGSQYRVESMMMRLAHSQNFLAISPSKEQVAAQPAMECLPLVLEPESKLYTSPVVVLDFQSLYPSMIIAYNLCFSTCLGKCISLNPKVLGVTKLWIPPSLLRSLVDKLIVTPNGIMFVPPEIAPGVLPRLLLEILSTRIMVKGKMKKLDASQRVLHRIFNARQFALKLIANVTYGYAAAGFSGRMPCAELADSIVQLGRHTLEQAINMVNSNPAWGARVVYGDTDSMFVLLEGRSRSEAFKIGHEIASAVTAVNPHPVALKMEKVYHPCVLLTKKRYVGYSYESPTQETPTFDAKGIETVRRDSCAAVAKTMEKSLRLLFETYDLSKVKQYLQRQWQKIFSGRTSIQDFVFSKEVRLGTYSTKSSVLPPAAIVASKAMAVDPRAEPCHGERIQYVVVHGKPGARLVDMVVDPYSLLDDSKGFRLHDTYYINKQILPALQRVFGLVGVDLRAWLYDMSRVYQLPAAKRPRQNYQEYGDDGGGSARRGRIDHYYASQHCAVCGDLMTQGRRQLTCQRCLSDKRLISVVLGGRASRVERELQHIQAICHTCGGGDSSGEVLCVSLDCPVFFERVKVKREFENSTAVLNQLHLE